MLHAARRSETEHIASQTRLATQTIFEGGMMTPKVLTQPSQASSLLAARFCAFVLFASRSVALAEGAQLYLVKARLLRRGAISRLDNIVRVSAR